jgi:hypothetical protein
VDFPVFAHYRKKGLLFLGPPTTRGVIIMKNIHVLLATGILLLLPEGYGFSFQPPEGFQRATVEKTAQKEGEDFATEQERLKQENRKNREAQDKLPDLPPPPNDPEMVIKPDVPPDPDAVIIPPPVDPEMAVDPTTREPMTKEDVEDLHDKDPSGGGTPDERGKSLPRMK